MPINDFILFATDGGALVQSQADYLASLVRPDGFQVGIADPSIVNKAIRQGTFMGAVVAQTIADLTGSDVLDDGNLASKVALLKAALIADLPPTISNAAITLSTPGDYVFNGGTACTWTLPAVAALAGPYYIKNRGTVNLTIAAAGAERLYLTSAIATLTVLPGDAYRIRSDGVYSNVG